jgi:signal transduction histidine kinase
MDDQQLLATVNAQVLLGSVYIRDALLGWQADGADSGAQVQRAFDAVDRALASYVPVLDTPGERERLARLRQSVREFRTRMLGVLETARTVPAPAARGVRWRPVAPRRDMVIGVSEEIRGLNREVFVEQHNNVARIYDSSQRWFWGTLTLAIVASFGIGLVAVRYAGRLEGRLEHQLVQDAEKTAELQRLSARLISVQEDERRTIARDLHDEVGQSLSAIKVELAVAERAIRDAGVGADVLKSARTITDGALTTVRDLSQLLHPAVLDDLGLPVAVEAFVRSFGQRHQLDVSLRQDHVDERLAPEVETCVYRVIQESLTNVAKHARAATCRVSLAWHADRIDVEIEDNGIGMPAEREQRVKGLGLIGMRERVHQLRGTFTIERPLSGGTRLRFSLPAPPRQSRADG